MTKKVVVFDYGSGNVHSVAKALAAVGADVELTSSKKKALDSDGLLVPGVGAFSAVMRQLEQKDGPEIIDRRLAGGRHVMGICVGLQVMFTTGTEHGVATEGLAQWPGDVHKLSAEIVPHIGWNNVSVPEDSKLFAGIEREKFYFVHSYAANEWLLDPHPAISKPLVSWCDYGGKFIAAVENGPLCATQFHPEKSAVAGLKLLANWVEQL